MVYILSAELMTDEAPGAAFERYQQYVSGARDRFPPGAYALATSGWYYDFDDHRCPHDAWLEELVVSERGSGPGMATRAVDVRIRLFGAYADGHIELRYRDVVRYRCELWTEEVGEGRTHSDWRYDEFRLSERGLLLHEIEWCSRDSTGTWLIEAADVEHTWIPLADAPAPAGG
ncbi:MAG TPA: hypothetical protein VF006_25935 [Longimicrobium sp.]